MSRLLVFLLIIAAGGFSTLQPSVNARLAQKVGVLPSASVSFAVGALTLIALVSLTGRAGGYRALGTAAWWELTGGLLGALYVTATIVSVPRIGTAAMMAVVIAAQLTTGLLLDQVGAFGMRTIALDTRRLLGVVFLWLGAVLVYRG